MVILSIFLWKCFLCRNAFHYKYDKPKLFFKRIQYCTFSLKFLKIPNLLLFTIGTTCIAIFQTLRASHILTHSFPMHPFSTSWKHLKTLRFGNQWVNRFWNHIFIFECYLTYFSPISHFYSPWKSQNTYSFLKFWGDIEMWHWPILVHCHISIAPENIRKPMVFWRFEEI